MGGLGSAWGQGWGPFSKAEVPARSLTPKVFLSVGRSVFQLQSARASASRGPFLGRLWPLAPGSRSCRRGQDRP